MGPGITWYEILGVLPGASADRIKREYDAKASLLRPEQISGAPSSVITAISRAQDILDTAWEVLSDPVIREHYDEMVGLRRKGGGLPGPGSLPSDPGWTGSDFDSVPIPGHGVLDGLLMMASWLTRRPRQPKWIQVPDVRGLFYSVCLELVGRLNLQVTAVRLTKHPMPVDGLVIDQSPRPSAKVRQASELTVQVWHPPVRSPLVG
jgi:hypothetical protein